MNLFGVFQTALTSAASLTLMVAAPAAGAGPSSNSTAATTSTNLQIYGRQGVRVGAAGWPTVYTNTQTLGIYYGWTYPYYISPYGYRPDGLPFWEPGYAPYWPRSTPGVPFLWNDAPWYWPRSYDGPPLVEIARRVDPALLNLPAVPAPPPPRAPTPEEMARASLEARDYERAALIYARLAEEQRAHESSSAPQQVVDRSADQMQALALAGARQFSQAAELLALARLQDPNAAPIDGAEFIASASEMRRIVTGAVAWAHTENSPNAWRLVAFLMEIEGRAGPAQRMLERAESLEAPAPKQPAARSDAQPAPGPARYSIPEPDIAPAEEPAQPDR